MMLMKTPSLSYWMLREMKLMCECRQDNVPNPRAKKLKKVTFNKYLSIDPQVPVDSYTQGDQTGFRTSVPVDRSKSSVDRYTQEIVSRKASLLDFANLSAPVDRCIVCCRQTKRRSQFRDLDMFPSWKQPPYKTIRKSKRKTLSLLLCFSTPSRTKKNNLLNKVEAGSSVIQASPSTDTCQDEEKSYCDQERVVATTKGVYLVVYFIEISRKEFNCISACTIAKEMWDKISLTYEGTNKVKKIKVDILIAKYKQFKMALGESISKMYGRFIDITNVLAALDKTLTTY
ncbi:hypothetical protein Taro_011682 [Colocasia esculenta]|uniref:Uncharacterized protein n=1 Tax=Colocasia esculenta TaxID=4460 RepID=A0A843UGV1_COLES|nr:hypothetical protein [Colocasia esculenta]